MWAWQVARQKGEKKDGKNAAIEYRSPGWVTCSSCCSGSFSGFPSSQFAWSQKQQRGLGTLGWGNWARAEQAEQFRVVVVWQTLSWETSPLTAAIQLSNTALHFLSPHSPHPTTAHPHRKVNSEPDKCRARGALTPAAEHLIFLCNVRSAGPSPTGDRKLVSSSSLPYYLHYMGGMVKAE